MKTGFSGFIIRSFAAVLAALVLSAPATDAKRKEKATCRAAVMSVIHKYDGCDGVETVNIGPFFLGIAKMAAGGEEGSEFLRYVDRMAVFSAEDATQELRSAVSEDLSSALAGYEKGIEVTDEDEQMAIYFRRHDDSVKEMVIYSIPDMAVIVMHGNFPVSELEKIATDAAQEY